MPVIDKIVNIKFRKSFKEILEKEHICIFKFNNSTYCTNLNQLDIVRLMTNNKIIE